MLLSIVGPPFARRLRPYILSAVLLASGLVLGVALAWLLRDPYTAKAERLAGTVTWSNQESRMIAFEADGQIHDPLKGDTIYFVTGGWLDASGIEHISAEYPACLAGKPGEPVTEVRHRITLDAIHQDTGGPQRNNIAVFVHCLD
jgi:hypothetical protein